MKLLDCLRVLFTDCLRAKTVRTRRASPHNLLNILDLYGCPIGRGWQLSMYNFQVQGSYDFVHVEDPHAVLRGLCMARTDAHTSHLAHSV